MADMFGQQNPGLLMQLLGAMTGTPTTAQLSPTYNQNGPNQPGAYNNQMPIGQGNMPFQQPNLWGRLLGNPGQQLNQADYQSQVALNQGNQATTALQNMLYNSQLGRATGLLASTVNPMPNSQLDALVAQMGPQNILNQGVAGARAGMTGSQNTALANTSLNPFIPAMSQAGGLDTLSKSLSEIFANIASGQRSQGQIPGAFNLGAAQTTADTTGANATAAGNVNARLGAEMLRPQIPQITTTGAQNTISQNQAAGSGAYNQYLQNQGSQPFMRPLGATTAGNALETGKIGATELNNLGVPVNPASTYFSPQGMVQTTPMGGINPQNAFMISLMRQMGMGTGMNFGQPYNGPTIPADQFRMHLEQGNGGNTSIRPSAPTTAQPGQQGAQNSGDVQALTERINQLERLVNQLRPPPSAPTATPITDQRTERRKLEGR